MSSLDLANVSVMNVTGYEAVTIGNNGGLTFAPQRLAELYGSGCRFQALCCNVIDLHTDTVPSYLLPSQVIDKGALRIGLIGVTAKSKHYVNFFRSLGWDIRDPIWWSKRLQNCAKASS